MKKKIVLLIAGVCSSGAFAESSVTVAGRIDLSVRSVDNGVARSTLMSPDGAHSSKLIFKGVEDLGGGLKAKFYLDTALSADQGKAGSSSSLFNRQSSVSLTGDFGEIRLGRDAAISNSTPGDFDAMNGKGVGNTMNLGPAFNFSNTNTFTRVNNAISYLTPRTLGGMYGQIQIAPSEDVIGNKYAGGSLGYLNGPVEVRATYSQTNVNKVGGVTVAEDKFSYASMGASYNFGFMQLMGSVTNWRSAAGAAGRRTQDNFNIGAMIPVGAKGSVNVAFTNANRKGAGTDAQDAKQLALQYTHKLSKRTELYTSLARLSQDAAAAADKASDGARYNVDGTQMTGRSGTSFEVGIVHAF